VTNPFEKLVTPKAFGAMLTPPRSERSIYRWINAPDGLPVTTLPSGAIRIDVESAWAWMKQRVKQRVVRRPGRRLSRPEAA